MQHGIDNTGAPDARGSKAKATSACNIVIIDDNPDDRVEIRRLLLIGSSRRYRFIEADTGMRGVKAVREHAPPHCVLLDYNLPDMAARDVLAAIKNSVNLTLCPVLVLTGVANAETSADVLRAGAQDILGKQWMGPQSLTRALENTIERHVQARELHHSEQRWRVLATAMPQLVWSCSESGESIFQAPKWHTITGQSAEQSLGYGWLEMIHPDDRDHARDQWRQSVSGRETYQTQYRLLQRDGGYRWYLARAEPLRDASGRILQWIGTCTDIDDAKQTEAKLSEALLLNQVTAAAARMGTWRIDIVTNRIDCSDEALAMLDIPPAQWCGQPDQIEARIVPEDIAATRRARAIATAHRSPVDFKFRIRKADGELRCLHARGDFARGGDGPPTLCHGVIQDVTERERDEQALLRYAEQLQQADRRKNEFLAMLAHELRNPLAPIRNAVEILRTLGPSDPSLDQARAMIARQVAHLTRLVDDLLDVARVTEGKIKLSKFPVDITAAAQAGVDLAHPLIDAKQQRLVQALPAPGTLTVQGDATRLAQAIGNLLNNAAKFTDAGGQIFLEAAAQGDQVVIEVRDTGIGISAEQLPTVFELFMQADRSLDRSEGGLGIGLSLVKTLIELHDGAISAHSDGLGHGSKFLVHLPIGPVPSAAQSQDWPNGPALPRRILVVDDNVDTIQSMALLLELEGHTVRTACDGLGAIAVCAEFAPEVCLLDIGLPGMNGYELVRRLREMVSAADAICVALTGYGHDEDRARALRAGFDHHLTKPVELDQLRPIIQSVSACPKSARLPSGFESSFAASRSPSPSHDAKAGPPH